MMTTNKQKLEESQHYAAAVNGMKIQGGVLYNLLVEQLGAYVNNGVCLYRGCVSNELFRIDKIGDTSIITLGRPVACYGCKCCLGRR